MNFQLRIAQFFLEEVLVKNDFILGLFDQNVLKSKVETSFAFCLVFVRSNLSIIV